MSNLKRYEQGSLGMRPDPEGLWCEYAKAQTEIERLRNENIKLHGRCETEAQAAGRLQRKVNLLEETVERLRAALDAIVRKPGAVNGLGYDMKQIAREALGLEDPT